VQLIFHCLQAESAVSHEFIQFPHRATLVPSVTPILLMLGAKYSDNNLRRLKESLSSEKKKVNVISGFSVKK
jgi:hypothetical protein